MQWILDNDELIETLAGLARNKKLPLDIAKKILNNTKLPAVVRLGALSHPDIKNDLDIAKRFMTDRDADVALIARKMYSLLKEERGLSEALLRQLIRLMV